MADPYDPAQGTVPADSDGPGTSDEVTSLSGNVFVAESGYYREDYFYSPNCSAQGEQYLDEHNGHDHGDHGYHYHVTFSFPYMPGPTLYGEVIDDQVNCGGSQQGGGRAGGPGDGPPPM